MNKKLIKKGKNKKEQIKAWKLIKADQKQKQ